MATRLTVCSARRERIALRKPKSKPDRSQVNSWDDHDSVHKESNPKESKSAYESGEHREVSNQSSKKPGLYIYVAREASFQKTEPCVVMYIKERDTFASVLNIYECFQCVLRGDSFSIRAHVDEAPTKDKTHTICA